MNFKTLLLGSAAVIASAAGSAQAADLSVAEPVDYVRVCDAFGEGYWYIPGTDTCLAISGRLDFGVKFGDSYPVDGHDFETYTRTELNVTAKSQTDWGPLTAFITWRGDHEYDRSDYESDYVVLDEAFLSLGPITAGFTQSIFDVHGGGYTDEGYDLTDYTVNQLALSWAFNGFGLAIALEEPKDYWGSSADDVPVISAALSTSVSGWDAALSFQYDAAAPDDTWVGVQGVVETEIGMWQFKLGALWVDYGDSYWVVNGSSKQNWQSNFYTAETVFYDDDAEEWGAAFTVAYSPVDSLWFLANAQTADEGDNWDYKIFLKKTFGPNS